ncbi:hypothetical protein Y1Q_0013460 [Alligator mississippiensis]|uniref:Uncharacterized protein n=1 Tax=Alligator mississippiensis TaxID=8496 RepID=A0A151MSD5_ALLMI|nr:hypothetical protein Y1Q_0013460 [Alligator mississippiensis]
MLHPPARGFLAPHPAPCPAEKWDRRSAHLCAVPHSWICFCCLYHLGISSSSLLLQMLATQAGTTTEPSSWW